MKRKHEIEMTCNLSQTTIFIIVKSFLNIYLIIGNLVIMQLN